MSLATVIDDASLTDVLIVLGLVGIAVKTVMEQKGWTRGSALLRQENEDLLRRNTELEHAVERLEGRVRELEQDVALLRQRDQTAVLALLTDHELQASERHKLTLAQTERTIAVLDRIADTLLKEHT